MAALLWLALLAPATALAADPAAGGTASAPAAELPSASASGVVVVDPSFVEAPTAAPSGSVLAATGRPAGTLPATDASTVGPAATETPLLPLLLGALAAASLSVARKPGARRR